MTQAEKVGTALARSIASPQVEDRDPLALALDTALTRGGFATISRGTDAQAQLVIVVTAEATDPPVEADLLAAHVELDLALRGPRGGGGRRTQQHRDRGHGRAGRPLGPAGQPAAEHGRRRRPDQRRGDHDAGRAGAAAGPGGTALRGAGPGARPRCRRCRCGDRAALGHRRGRRNRGGAGHRAGQPQGRGRGGHRSRRSLDPDRTTPGQPVTLAEGPLAAAGLLAGLVVERALGAPAHRTAGRRPGRAGLGGGRRVRRPVRDGAGQGVRRPPAGAAGGPGDQRTGQDRRGGRQRRRRGAGPGPGPGHRSRRSSDSTSASTPP